jgi:Sporulation protein Cse60
MAAVFSFWRKMFPFVECMSMRGVNYMVQVKIFDVGTISKLQEEINGFLSTMSNSKSSSFKLIDIKFNSYSYGEDGTDYHSAMIIYQM